MRADGEDESAQYGKHGGHEPPGGTRYEGHTADLAGRAAGETRLGERGLTRVSGLPELATHMTTSACAAAGATCTGGRRRPRSEALDWHLGGAGSRVTAVEADSDRNAHRRYSFTPSVGRDRRRG